MMGKPGGRRNIIKTKIEQRDSSFYDDGGGSCNQDDHPSEHDDDVVDEESIVNIQRVAKIKRKGKERKISPDFITTSPFISIHY